MNRRFSVLPALLLLAGTTALYSQSNPSNPDQSDSVEGQQNPTGTCPDGLPPGSMGDGTVGCPSLVPQQQGQSGTSQQDNRRSTVAGPGESTDLTGQSKTKNTLQNQQIPPEPLTEFQKFVAATTGQLLPIYGANLFRNVPSTFSPNDLAPVS